MYRFVCTHLSKSRNISGTCKKISQSTRYHFSNSKPSSSSATRERSEEPEDTNNNETSAENSNRPVTCPAKLQHVHVCTKTFGLGNVKNASHLAEHPKLYTNNFLTVNPPVPSISKKYFHIYSISKDRIPIDDPAIPVKRLYSGYSYRHLGTDELDNYKMALHDLQRIKSQKLDSQWRPKTSGSYKSSSAHSSSMWLKTRKRHTSKTDISYPTHTINHHLKLNKRYRIREGATDCQVDVLEQALISSKKMEEQMQRVTQCLDAKYSKKGKMITNKPKRENLINITISKKKSTSSAKARKSQKSQERPEVSPTAQSYIQYHPTIKNASKEVKMRLKRKYVQLLLKPSKQQGLLSSNWNQPEVKDELEEEPYQDDNVKAEETNAEEANFSEFEKEAVAQPAEIVMAEMEDHVESARYPQRVYVDISTPYEIDKVCLITKSDKHSSEAQKVSRSEILDENTEAIQPTSNQRGPKVQKAQINLANMEKDLENTNKFIKELTDLEDRNLGSLAEQVRISKKIDQLMQHREKITQELRSLIAVPGKKNEVAEPRIKPPEKTEIEPLEYDEIENLNSEAVKKNQRANRLRRIMEHHSIIEERNAQMELQKPKINTRKSSIMKNIGELLEKNKRRDQVKQELLDLELGNIKPLSRSEEERMIQKHPQMKSIQAKPAAPETTEASSYLEEPDEVEELNEKASAKVRMARHQNMLRRQQMEIDKLKEQMAAVVATPTVEKESPKGDKKIAVLVEKNNRAERVREKIENFNDSTTGREKEHATRVTRPRQDVKPMKEDSRAEPTTERSDEITTETEIHKKVPASKIEDTVKKILNAVLLNQIIPPVKSELQQEDVEKESEEKLCSLANENMKSSKDKKNDKIKRIEEPTKNQTQDSQNGTHNSPQKEAISPKQQKEPVCSIPTLKEKDPSEDDEDLDVVLVRDRENQNKEVTAKERPKEVPSHDLKEKTSTNQETLQCRYQKLLSELGIKNINGIVPVDVAKELEPIPIKTKKEIQPVCETTGIMINPNLTQQEYKSDMNQNKNSVIQLKSSKETGTVKEENIKDLIIQPNLEAKDITKIDPKKADLSVNITDAIKTVMLDDTLHTVEKLNETPLKYYVSTINAIEKTTEKPLECRVEIGAPNSIFSGKNVSGKTTENPLECRVDNLISTCKKVPEILTISNINETVMKEYFMEKILPGTFETIYLPKSEVVVNFKNEPMEAKTYIGHAQCPVNDNKGSSINESKNVEDKIKKKVIKLKDGISELYTRVKRKSSREMTMKQFEMSAGDSEQKADKAKDNENVKMNEGINIKNIEKSCENKTQTEVLDTKPSSTSSKQSYPKNSVSRLGNKIRVPPPVRPPSGKDKEKRKKDKPKGKKDMVLPPKRKDGDTGAVLSGKSYKPESSKNSEKNTAEKISGLEGNKLIKSTNDLQQTKGTLEVQRDTTVGQTSKTEPQKKDSSKTVVATSEKIDKMEEKKPLKSLDNYKYEEEKSETQRDVVLPNKLSLNSVAPQASQQVHELKTNVTNTGRILNLQENKPISGEYKHEKDKFKEQKNIATHPLRASEKTSHQGYSAKSSGTDVERAFNLGENKSTKSLDIIPPLGASEKKSHLGYSAKSSGTDIERPSNFGENNSTKSLGIVPSLGASEKTSHQGYSAKSSGTDVERASNFGENKSTKSRDIVPPLGASEKKSHLGCSAKSCGTDTERPSSFGENKSTKSLGFAPSLGASEKTSNQGYSAKSSGTDAERASNLGENKSTKSLDIVPSLGASEKKSYQGYSAKSNGTDTERASNFGENKSTKSLGFAPPLGASEKTSHQGYSAKSSGTDTERASNYGENKSTKSLGIVPPLGASEKTSHQGYSAKSSGTDTERGSNFGENKSTKSQGIVPPLGVSEKTSHQGYSAKSSGTDAERASNLRQNKSMKPLDAYKNKSAQSKEQKHKALTAKLRASNSIILSENIISQREKHTQSTTNNTGKAPKQPEKKPTNSLDITSKNDAKISSTGNTSSISFHPNRQQLKIAEKTDLGISKVIAVKHTVSTNANQTKDKKLDALSAKISWTQNSRQNQIINTEMLNMEIRKRQPLKEFKTPDIAEEIVPQVKDKRFESKSFWIQDQKLDKQALNKEIQDRYTMKQFRNLASVPEPFPSPLAKYCAPQHCINKKALELEIFERQSRRVQKRINTVDMNSSNKFLNIQISPNTALRDPPPKIPEIKRSHSARNSAEAKSNLPRKRWENNAYSEIWSTSPKANDSAREEKTNKMDGQNKNGSFKVLSLNKLDQDKEEAPKKTSKPLKDLKNNANEPRDVNKTKENNFHTMHNVNNRKQSIKDKLESGKTTQQTERDDKQSVRPSSCPPLKSGVVNYSSGTKNMYKQGKLQMGSRDTLNYISGSVPPGNNKPPGPMKKEPLKDKDDAVCNKNLKQDHPMLVLNVTLPKIEISTASGNSKETKVISSCSGEFKLWGKLENETVKSPSGSGPIKEKKIPQKPKADTSTMSLGTLGDRHFHKRSNPNYAPEKLEPAKNKTIEESPRKAVFQILPDSESVVIQKAEIDEKKPKEETRSKSEKKYFYKKQDSEPAEMQTKSPPDGLKPDLQKSRKNISTNSSSTDKKVLNNFSNTPGTKKDEPKKPVEEIGELLIKEVQKVFQKPDNEKGLTLESKTGKSTSPITNTDKAHSKKTDIVQPKNKEDLSKKPSPKEPDTVNTSELGKGKATSEDISNIQRKSKYEIQLKCSKKDDFNLTKADGSFKSHIKEVAKRKKEDSKETTKKRIVAWPHEKQSKNYEIQMKCTKLENLQEDTPNEKIKEGSTLKPTLEAKSDAKPKSENTKSVARSQIKKVQVVEKLDKPEEDQTNKKLTANSDKESPRSEILEKNIKNVEENLIKFGFFKPKTESNVNDVPQKDGELPKETAPAEATEKAKIDQQEAAVLKPSEVEKQQTKSKEVSSSGIKKESTALKSSEVEKQQTMNKEVSTSEIKKESPALKSSEVEKQQATNKEVPSSEIKKESIVLKLNYIENQKTKYNRAAADAQPRDPVKQAIKDMKTKSKKASTSTLLKKKTKKDEVEEINSAAQYLLEQEKKKRYEEMLKGKKKQKKYEQDAKIVAPSIGNTDWGVEIKSRTPTEETKNDSFDDTLMSKSEYLRWKEQKEKNESFKVDQAVLNHKIKKIANIMADTMKQEEDSQLKHDYDVSLKCSKVTDYSLDDQNLLEVEHKTRAQRLEESIREKNANKIKRNLGKEQDDDHRKGQNLTLTKKLDVAETSKNLNNTKPPKCAKIILPLKKLPKQTFEQSLEEYSSILKKPVGDEIKTVPKGFNAEKNKKSTNKALAKYSHLKISFMTVKRPVKKDEKFLPAVVKKKRYVPRGVSKEDRNKIIQMRYEMLKQLQENFNKDNTANLPPEAVQKTEVVIPYKFDTVNVKQPDKKKKETETIEKPKVQHMKGVISNVRPKNAADLQQLTRSVSGSNKKTGDKDGKITKKNKDGLFGAGKGGDMGKSKKYSTMAEKSDGCDENGCEGSSTTKNECEKTSSGEAQEECQTQSPSKVDCPESQGFDVMEAVPQAFQCPSQELEEERQKNLYYRYHQHSFNDLHSYLHDQRTFVKEKKEKEKEKEIGERDSKTAKDCTEK